MKREGRLFWVTGLAGAGKTTIGKKLHERLNVERAHALFLDGDMLRETFGFEVAHSQEERRQIAMRYSRFCRAVTKQGLDVVMATISMFHEVREWNRRNVPSYTEIYVRVPMDILVRRDQKGLYSRAMRGEISNVMGVDIPIEEPRRPDLILVNDGSSEIDELVDRIFQKLELKTGLE